MHTLGRCEKGIFQPTFSDHILKFTYEQMLTNKKDHLKFCGPEDTALFPSPVGLKYKEKRPKIGQQQAF
jgi:hypothetical protein